MKSAAFQSFLVVLGVVLAYAANEWREARIDRRAAEAALASVMGEIAANRDAVDESRSYHQQRLALIAERESAGEAVTYRDFPKGFVQPAAISSAAWTSASETGALANIPYGRVLALSHLYDLQANYADQASAARDIIYREIFEKGTASVAANATGMRSLIAAFHYRETELSEAYQEALGARGPVSADDQSSPGR